MSPAPWPLPRAVAQDVGVALQVLDYGVAELQGKAPSGGTTRLDCPAVEAGYLWRVERIVITSTNAGAAQLTVSVYAGDVLPSRLRDATVLPAGYSAVAEYPALLTIGPALALVLVVAGGTAGDIVTASVQYQLVQRAAGG